MKQLLTTLLNIIFPPRPSERLIQNIDVNDLDKLFCIQTRDHITHLAPYSHPSTQALITENKFHNNTLASQHLQYLLKKWSDQQAQRILFVPIPLGKERKRQRGYNQVERIIGNLASYQLLTKLRDTVPQTTLARSDRLNNLTGVFSYNNLGVNLNEYDTVVIVDDVSTTGTTLKEARATLAPHLPTNTTLICLAIAH
tara:strand:- start:150 stop:743 length:594 start_codon:yes stop_codon:yes gene_type:complete